MSEVIARDAAEKELARMGELFCSGFDSADDREKVLAAIMEGRVVIDDGKEELVYTLASPIELKNGTVVSEVKLHEPTAEDLEYINKGFMVRASADGQSVTMDMADVYTKTIRMLTKLSGMQLAVSERIKRRDMATLTALCNFFG